MKGWGSSQCLTRETTVLHITYWETVGDILFWQYEQKIHCNNLYHVYIVGYNPTRCSAAHCWTQLSPHRCGCCNNLYCVYIVGYNPTRRPAAHCWTQLSPHRRGCCGCCCHCQNHRHGCSGTDQPSPGQYGILMIRVITEQWSD